MQSEEKPAGFDLIYIDGDHSFYGAYSDLKNTIKLLAPGGVLVFDDRAHPRHYYLTTVWKKIIKKNPSLHDYTYTALGKGIAIAIQRSDFPIKSFPWYKRIADFGKFLLKQNSFSIAQSSKK